MSEALLTARDLTKHFPLKGGFLNRGRGRVQALDGVSFEVRAGETLGVVGESGCGKSTTARLLMRLIEPDAGEVIFDGRRVGPLGLSLRGLRRQVQMVFQDSYASLNPRLPVAESIAYGPFVHGVSRPIARARARDLLHAVGLDPGLFARRYPHQLSGGQRQRVNIARALALEPRLIILDEAVSALDKSIAAQVLNLLADLKERFRLTYLFISHDLNVVRHISDRVMVMYLGKVVEIGDIESVYGQPRHPYTRALLSAVPSMDPARRTLQVPLSGDPPNPIDPPSGCRFRTRCPHAEDVCARAEPALHGDDPAGDHAAACHMLAGTSGTAVRPEDGAGVAPPVVVVRDLHVTFVTRERTVHAVNGVSFDLAAGEVLGILGESGSGKSVTLRALIGLLPPATTRIDGEVRVAGRDLSTLSGRALADFRGRTIAMIFQEPMTALDPVYTIGRQIEETIVRHEGVSYRAARQRALELLELVQIPSPARRLTAYPSEMSGGMRQRAMIALALSGRPSILLADEPTTALDVTVQMQIILLLRQLQRELGMAVVFVTHDVGVSVEIADRLAVMYAGRFVESGPTDRVIGSPRHPYTEGLLRSTIRGPRLRRLPAIPGAPPDLRMLPSGCAFAPRCRVVEDRCLAAVPAEAEVESGHTSRCVRAAEAPRAGLTTASA